MTRPVVNLVIDGGEQTISVHQPGDSFECHYTVPAGEEACFVVTHPDHLLLTFTGIPVKDSDSSGSPRDHGEGIAILTHPHEQGVERSIAWLIEYLGGDNSDQAIALQLIRGKCEDSPFVTSH
jgi:hypothetical protein